MKYWAMINGKQVGPLDLDQLRNEHITPDTYVWCKGLPDWIKAEDIIDLRELLAESKSEPIVENVETESPAEEIAESKPVEDTTEEVVAEEVTTEIEAPSPEEAEQPQTPETPVQEPSPTFYYKPQEQAPKPQAPTEPIPECPPTNLAWAIVFTVLCCNIFGIIAIIYAAQVTSKYNAGDYAGAKKYSDRAEIWCIVTFCFGVVVQPILSILSILF